MKKVLCISIIISIILTNFFIIQVNAETLDLYKEKLISFDGNICTIEYYIPDNNNYVFTTIIRNERGTSKITYDLIYYEAGTTFTYDGSYKCYKADRTFLYSSFDTYENAKKALFEGQGTADYTEATAFPSFTYGKIYLYQESTYASEAAESLEVAYYDWYVEKNGTEPTFKQNNNENNNIDSGLVNTIIEKLKTLIEKITDIPTAIENLGKLIKDMFKLSNGTLVFDKAGELINENLKNNQTFNSILDVKETLNSLFNEDYTSRTGFYELGLTNITLRKTQKTIYKDFGNDVIGDWDQEYHVEGKIDYGLENAKVLNLDWFFGEELGNGYYTKGLKSYTDTIVSAFLWLMFGWSLYRNMPNWISGELTEITNLGYAPIVAYNNSINKKNKQLELESKQKEYAKQKEYNNSYEAYKEKMDRSNAYRERYRKEKKGK